MPLGNCLKVILAPNTFLAANERHRLLSGFLASSSLGWIAFMLDLYKTEVACNNRQQMNPSCIVK